ncbi:MAG: adenylyl-sulfate kinase, partial [Candidatus Aminicenantes bacterium]|nr:adenylyl-sulfate kinase [Candidatus Aminicenantes bacterium]
EIRNFTGISDPFEEPERPEVVVETDKESEEESLQKILAKMEDLGYLRPPADDWLIPEYLRQELLKNPAKRNFPDLSTFVIHILSQYVAHHGSGGGEISQTEEDAAKEKLKKLGYLS